MFKKILSIFLMPVAVVAFAFGTPSISVSAETGNSILAVPPPPTGGTGYFCHYYNKSEASKIYTDASNFGWTAGIIGLVIGPAGWTYASGLLGASGIGVATNLSPFDTAHFKNTGVRICHDGYKIQPGSPNMAFYDNVFYAYY